MRLLGGNGLVRLGRSLLVIGLELRLGDGLDFGSPVAEVASEESNGDESSEKGRDRWDENCLIHWEDE